MDAVVHWSGEAVRVADDTVLTIGVFDGLHLGHQALIREAVSAARREGVPAAGLTFFPSPEVVLRAMEPLYLMLPEERADFMLGLGLDLVIISEFSLDMAVMGAEEFMERLSYSFGPREVWVGEDFALGRDREGGLEALTALGRRLGYRLCVLPRCRVGDDIASSTLVRRCLGAGNVEKAARLLGRPYSVCGRVVPGDGRGRHLGYPTANIAVHPHKRLPADGVYCAYVEHDGQMTPAVVNVGVRPTFGAETRTVEAHLLGFTGDLYGELVRLCFVERLRGEQRFSGAEELMAQLAHDVEDARRVFELGTAFEAGHGL
ncbi:MAG: riboflavin biosynthesis protein RibF [Anaerolineae bacterium]|jgi:riboflavin kinase/FMN adenylyltransferase